MTREDRITRQYREEERSGRGKSREIKLNHYHKYAQTIKKKKHQTKTKRNKKKQNREKLFITKLFSYH